MNGFRVLPNSVTWFDDDETADSDIGPLAGLSNAWVDVEHDEVLEDVLLTGMKPEQRDG